LTTSAEARHKDLQGFGAWLGVDVRAVAFVVLVERRTPRSGGPSS